MDDAAVFGKYLFLLAIFLIAVAYFAGFVADSKSVLSGVTSLINTATGRSASGAFAGYPGNAPATAGQ